MAKDVEFEEFDVTRDQQALDDLVEAYRSRITPTIVIGERVIIGFDREQLDELFASPPPL